MTTTPPEIVLKNFNFQPVDEGDDQTWQYVTDDLVEWLVERAGDGFILSVRRTQPVVHWHMVFAIPDPAYLAMALERLPGVVE